MSHRETKIKNYKFTGEFSRKFVMLTAAGVVTIVTCLYTQIIQTQYCDLKCKLTGNINTHLLVYIGYTMKRRDIRDLDHHRNQIIYMSRERSARASNSVSKVI